MFNWTNFQNHKLFFDQPAQKFDINQSRDWYKVTREDVYHEGGQKLLQQYYHNSLYEVINKITMTLQALKYWYPDQEIYSWMFEDNVSNGFWKNPNNHRYQ